MQIAGRELHVDRVRGTMQPSSGSERRMAVEGVRDHDGIAYREGVWEVRSGCRGRDGIGIGIVVVRCSAGSQPLYDG